MSTISAAILSCSHTDTVPTVRDTRCITFKKISDGNSNQQDQSEEEEVLHQNNLISLFFPACEQPKISVTAYRARKSLFEIVHS